MSKNLENQAQRVDSDFPFFGLRPKSVTRSQLAFSTPFVGILPVVSSQTIVKFSQGNTNFTHTRNFENQQTKVFMEKNDPFFGANHPQIPPILRSIFQKLSASDLLKLWVTENHKDVLMNGVLDIMGTGGISQSDPFISHKNVCWQPQPVSTSQPAPASTSQPAHPSHTAGASHIPNPWDPYYR